MTSPANAVVQFIGLQGPPGPVSANVTELSALASLPANPASSLNGMLVGYTPTAGGQSSYFQWAPSSTATPDGVHVVAGNGGNWLLVQTGSLSVTARTGLTALADVLLQDGAPVYNSESGYQADWVLRKTSTLTVDNLTVVATASGVGRFVLKSRIAGRVPVTECGANGDGATDDSGAFQAALNALAYTGVTLLCPAPASAFLFTHEVLVPSGTRVESAPGCLFHLNMTPSGSQLTSCAFASFPTKYGSVGTVEAAPTTGGFTVSVTMPQAPVVGHFLQLQHGNSFITYSILGSSSLGGSNYSVTVERPIVFPWQIGDSVQEFSAVPQDVVMDMGNATFTGPGDRYIESVAAQRWTVRNAVANASQGSISDVSFGMDLGGVENLHEGFHSQLGSNVSVGATVEAQERSVLSHSRFSGVPGDNQIGVAFDDCYASGGVDCHTYSIDIGFKTQAVGGGFGCIDAYMRACSSTGGITGVQVTSSDGFDIDTFTGVGHTGSTVLLSSGTNTTVRRLVSRSSQFGLNVQTGVTGTRAEMVEIVNPTSAGVSGAGDLVLTGLVGSVSSGAPTMIEATAGRHIYRGLSITYTAGTSVTAISLDASFHDIDGANVVMTGTSSAVGIVCQSGTTVLRGVKVTGANVGLQVLSGATVIIGPDCDFSGCTNPIQLLSGGVIIAQQGGLLALTTTGGSTTLTAAQQFASVIQVTGTLTSNALIYIPEMVNNSIPGLEYSLYNGTTGSFSVTFAGLGGGGGVTLAQGKRCSAYMDAANNLQRVGPDT